MKLKELFIVLALQPLVIDSIEDTVEYENWREIPHELYDSNVLQVRTNKGKLIIEII